MKILQIDIETSPNVAHVWGLFKQTVGINQLMESSRTMCFAAKWYGEPDIEFMSEFHHGHEYMIRRAHELLEQADAVIHYNGTRFDIPTLNKEFLLYGMAPPDPYHQIDLLQVAKNRFRFPSNKLDYVAQRLGIGAKVSHEGHELWIKCMNNDPEAWENMKTYNVQDVQLLEELYERFRPWIKGHPNAGLYKQSDVPVCTNCGSEKLHKKGLAYTNVGIYQRYRCVPCGTPLRGRYTLVDKDTRSNILSQDKA